MKPHVTVHNRQRVRPVDTRLLRQISKTLLAEWLRVERVDLGINLVAEPEMTGLNEKFLHHKGSTDVIAFDYTENVAQASRLHQSACSRDGCATLHGEIFVCMDEAVLQAQKFRASWQSEVVRYLVHGILHLLGHDDFRAGARRKMKREENRLLRKLSRRFALSKL